MQNLGQKPYAGIGLQRSYNHLHLQLPVPLRLRPVLQVHSHGEPVHDPVPLQPPVWASIPQPLTHPEQSFLVLALAAIGSINMIPIANNMTPVDAKQVVDAML